MYARASHVIKNTFCLACNPQARCSRAVGYYLHVGPRNFPAPARLQCFQKRFLSGESDGIRLSSRDAFSVAIITLVLCKNTRYETRSSGQDFAYAIDFNNVEARG